MTQQFLPFQAQNRAKLKERQLEALREPDYVAVDLRTCVIAEASKSRLIFSGNPWLYVKSLKWLRLLREYMAIRKKLIERHVREKVSMEDRYQRDLMALTSRHDLEMARLSQQMQEHMDSTTKVIIGREEMQRVEGVEAPDWAVDPEDDIPF